MKIKDQTRKLAEAAQNTVLRLQIELTGLNWIFEEYKHFTEILSGSLGWQMTFPVKNGKIRKNNLRIEEKRCKKRFW
ncbi:chlorohydrolase [Streptococcus pneumoniae]|uniref:chlorohydrolase n=1 Tax=Streptococcus pneumoniae TaxID=1313 RepID=UPI001242EBCB|nr:chlorohydrolase [Streptococcus pneumoniae]